MSPLHPPCNVISFSFYSDDPSNELLETQSLKECKQRGQAYNESRELVIRWMQLATFLPVIRYARLPSDCDPQVLQLTKNLTSLRQQTVSYFYCQRFPFQTSYRTIQLTAIENVFLKSSQDAFCSIVKSFIAGFYGNFNSPSNTLFLKLLS